MKKLFKRLLIVFAVFIIIIVILLVVSLRPVDTEPFRESQYYKNTLAHLDQVKKTLPAEQTGGLMVGTGKAGLTPPLGVPLAGYGARKGAPSNGVHDSLFVRTIVVQSQGKLACIIGYDMLLLNPPLARQIEDSIKVRFGLNPDQLLYTATHTHSGPGGWGQGWLEEQFSGAPDVRSKKTIMDGTLKAIAKALADPLPADYTFGSLDAPRYIRNRLIKENGTVDPELVYLSFWRQDKVIALLATYSAHATVLSARNLSFSGDYPGYFQRKVESVIDGPAIFAAAGLGSHSFKGEGKDFEKAQYVGYGLADSLLAHLEKSNFHSDTELTYFRLPVPIHDLQVRVSDGIRLAPWLARHIFHVGDSYMQVLALDDFVIIGSPGEFSGELALQVKKHAKNKGIKTTITSFNGCYVGYVTPSQYYKLNTYETRLMSWFGPYTGDYFTDIMQKIIDIL